MNGAASAGHDYVVVGSGLTGSVIARILHDAGQDVIVLERRAHCGGNVHDHLHASGIRVHTYGPHYFRTNDERIWSFVRRFAEFYPYEARLKSFVDGNYEDWPVAASYIRRTVGDNWKPHFEGTPANFEEASLAMMPRLVYEKFVKGYSEKQWGVPASHLSADLAKRFVVHEGNDSRLSSYRYQGIPRDGYAAFMKNMLQGIPFLLECDYLKRRGEFPARHLTVFTGPIDEFFGFDQGKLKYRGQERAHEYLPDIGTAQPAGQVNNPDPKNGPHIRTLEWKQMMEQPSASGIRGTVITKETTFTPSDPNEYEYPFPDKVNADLYQSYRTRAAEDASIVVCGRLGEYRYFDMDQAIGRATMLAKRILSDRSTIT